MMSYIEKMKELFISLPNPSEFDYTKVTKEELWEKIYNYFVKIGFSSEYLSSDEKIDELRRTIDNYNLYGKNKYLLYGDGTDFDQNNYFIHRTINEIRLKILKIVRASKRDYDSSVGEIEEIADFISIKIVEKFVTTLLTMSKEKGDLFRLKEFDISDIIFDYYLLDYDIYNADSYIIIGDKKVIAKEYVESRISDIVFKCATFVGEYGKYESVSHSSESYNVAVSQAVKPITMVIIEMAIKKLNKRKKADKALLEEQKEKQVGRVIVPEKASVKMENSSNDTKSIPYAQDDEDKSLTERDLDAVMSKYEQMQQLMSENKKLYEKLLDIEKQIKEMEKQKAEILMAIDKNDKKLREGMPRGIK